MKRRRLLILASLAAGIALIALTAALPRVWTLHTVSGTVRDRTGQQLADATVRVKATETASRTDGTGRFSLSGFTPAFRVRVTAWKDGYYVAGADAWPWDTSVEMTLVPYAVPDNPDYAWIPPAVDRSALEERLLQFDLTLAAQVSFKRAFLPLADRFTLGCRDCHGQTINDQWVAGAHALGAQNLRFLSMYNGTDVAGNQSPPTRRGYSRDYGAFPLRPDPTKPYYGPGYRLDFPHTAGNCAACHLPGAALGAPFGTDPNYVTGVDAQGSHCDFCHKIVAVKLDSATGRPHENMPGILSIEFMRPGAEKQLFFGPYDDVDVGPDTYLPLMKESEICAPCHDARFWGTPIYESFAEWKASPYAAEGITCQNCHMRPDGVATNFAPGRGGLERDPASIPTHHFPGAFDETLLQNAVTLEATAEYHSGQVTVTATITNDKTGHHVPTDSPLRQMILLVQASDEQGQLLPLLDGPTVPVWGGVGNPDEGYYAGLPGKGFAKILRELWTEATPTGAYWNPTRIVSDNRIAAFSADTSRYAFATPDEGDVAVEVTLLFRRAFIELMEQKDWDVPDIIMAQQSFLVSDSKRREILR